MLKRRVEPALVAGLTFLFQLPFFDRWYSAMDEGHMLQFADIVAHGDVLYREATSYPLPGAFYLLALVFRLGEPSILLSRWVVVVEFSLFVALLFVLLRGMVRPGFSWAGVAVLWLYRIWVFPHWQIYNYTTTSFLVLLVALMLLIRFLESKDDRRWLVAAGVALGLGIFCKQDHGAGAMAAMLFVLAVHAAWPPAGSKVSFLRLSVWLVLPAAGVGAAAALHFLQQGVLGDVVRMTVLNPFTAMASYEFPPFPGLLPLFRQDPALRDGAGILSYLPSMLFTADMGAVINSWLYQKTSVVDTTAKAIIYGPWLFILVAGLRLWRRRGCLGESDRRAPYLREASLLAFGAFVFVMAFLRPPHDYLHVAVGYWGFLTLCVVYGDSILRTRRRLLAASVLLIPATLVVGGYSITLIAKLRDSHPELVALDRGGIRVRPNDAAMLRDLATFARERTRPDEPLAVLPYFPMLHFLAERRAPHRTSYIVWPVEEIPGRDQLILDAIDASGSDLVIYHFTQFLAFPLVQDYAPTLFEGLVEDFEIERVFTYEGWGNQRIAALRRTREPEPGRPLSSEGAVVWTEAAEGARRTGERNELLDATVWPFRPAWALRPTAGGGRTGLSLDLDVPAGARLRTAVGVHPRFWFKFRPTSLDFELAVQSVAGRRVLYHRTLDPHRQPADRGWFELEVSLSDYAGQSVTLELTTATETALGETLLTTAWAEPRLVTDEP
ncbi:MAG: glycosyltransferase family 39 protein [Deltaproteobacteria bacterium]|nr:glycosyltransferase family 39 protein [Deltaproteobacteria bacterium]